MPFLLIPGCLAAVLAHTVPAAPVPLHQRIDQLIATGASGSSAAPITSDAEFLRRVSLDLTGTIPTAAEARAFLADTDPHKRAQLIDRLLASPEHTRHLARVFDVWLMDRRPDAQVPHAAWLEYLRTGFAANKPYDVLVRELLAADGADSKARPAAKFLLDRKFEQTEVTRDISRLFLGRNLQCAQCHDHPLVDDYKQADFYGILAFLNRSFLYPDAEKPNAVLAEKADGEVSFVDVFDKKKTQRTTAPHIPGGKSLTELKPAKGQEYKVAPAKGVRPVPAFSRRAQLAQSITGPENVAFRRTSANRFWALLMGRGLVHPLDFDHANNPPSHPELLTLLADEFAAHKFDVRWLLREIALSQTYQRSSEQPDAAEPDRFLAATLKPLSPEQLGLAVMQASGFTDAERQALGKNLTDAALDAKLAPQLPVFVRTFGGLPGQPQADGFTATLDQSLFLKNGPTIRGWLAPRPGNLIDRLLKLSNPNAVADELFLSVLTRTPTAEERQAVAELLRGASNRPAELSEIAWALLASSEFRFNH